MPDIFAEDLDSLTADKLTCWEALVAESEVSKARGSGVDAAELNNRLRRSPDALSTEEDICLREDEKNYFRIAKDTYDTIVGLGGRPSGRMQPTLIFQKPEDAPRDVDTMANEVARLLGELERWSLFRKYQSTVRKNRRSIRSTRQHIHSRWLSCNLHQGSKPIMRARIKDQTKLEEWQEFYFFQHQILHRKEEQIRQAQEQELESVGSKVSTTTVREKRVMAAKRDRDVWNTWLKWIEGQMPVIAMECANENSLTSPVRDEVQNIDRDETFPHGPLLETKRPTANVQRPKRRMTEESLQDDREVCSDRVKRRCGSKKQSGANSTSRSQRQEEQARQGENIKASIVKSTSIRNTDTKLQRYPFNLRRSARIAKMQARHY
ncbi:hypothetical protein ACLMJK_007683 [Lecanora helva]